VGFDVADQIV